MQLIPVETRTCTPTPVYVCFCMFIRVFACFFWFIRVSHELIDVNLDQNRKQKSLPLINSLVKRKGSKERDKERGTADDKEREE